MSNYFPLILVLLVLFTGIVWLADRFFLAPKRVANSGVDKKPKEPLIVEYSKSFFPVLFIVLVVRSFLIEPFQIPSGSMIPTLEVGDFIVVNKFTYGIRLPVTRTKIIDISDPKKGDIMVFFPPERLDLPEDFRPDHKQYYIKRVVGVPGDTVFYEDDTLYVNDQKMVRTDVREIGNRRKFTENLSGHEHVVQEYVDDEDLGGGRIVRANTSMSKPVTLKDGEYFMMGDNRDNSGDSRSWGPVPEENIVGKAFGIWMHWESFTSLPSFSRAGGIE
ncbi:signal peptidase I [bacterium]|nr:signal peptidase I [bacterium]